VSVSGLNHARRRAAGPPARRAAADERLRVEVRAAFRRGRGCYGAPRVERELRAAGRRVARKRVARLMREDGLRGRAPRRWVRTTDARHAEPVAPNLLARRFGIAEHPAPNAAWVGDQTYLPTREGWPFLSVLLDLHSRRVVGWATRATLATDGPLAALRMALAARRPAPGLLHHTDRGAAYASRAYRAVLAAHGAVPSMSRTATAGTTPWPRASSRRSSTSWPAALPSPPARTRTARWPSSSGGTTASGGTPRSAT
jgi:transposase InsO family protein